MATIDFPAKLREMNWDAVRSATFHMKSGQRIKARPPKGQKFAYDSDGDAIRYDDGRPSSWTIPVLEIEAVFITTIKQETK